MTRLRRALLAVVVLVGLVGVGGSPAVAAGTDIRDQLEAAPGVTVLEEQPVAAPYRFFVLSITQPVDHLRPGAGTFQQRFTLLHRGTDRPTVLHTTGYNVPGYAFRSEPTRLIDGNQLSVEQRFFTPSRPEPADWSKLTIWQAATDHHRIVAALKPIYRQRWISTGASKGGMTSVYHRRFYPGDVDGTVAYVAPQDVVNGEDSAYDRFFTKVGTAQCRAALDAVQVEALRRRAELVARYEAWAADNARTFSVIGSADRAFEFMVNGTTWAFWQYSLESDCAAVPPATASSDDIWAWLDEIYGLDSNTDQGVTPYIPYYFQASYQLGYPDVSLPHLAGLQHYRGQDRAQSYIPQELVPRFQPFAMLDVDAWVKLSGRRLLFVYGQNDPWGAEPFRLGPGTWDSLTYTAAGANHGANISRLTADEAATATAAVQRWAGVPAPASLTAAAPSYIPVLDDRDPVLDRRFNRP
ncbi:aminopeptidase [Dactylosporangium aurantiacum]|uniref:Aminopeptidase n=1 Tax=Dactylosporangium aurantiacum TaxID=35754 RepID=A0A9Q9IB20_9ACTN|nr:S28 family serine protease [Dactylosporangium aurantiacum]MDG6101698.1 S28 family serine protease [Dactylosporangium aurantiacum]UWZ52486.1 aminopeptidase [Dactylosporangium aurantiacum]